MLYIQICFISSFITIIPPGDKNGLKNDVFKLMAIGTKTTARCICSFEKDFLFQNQTFFQFHNTIVSTNNLTNGPKVEKILDRKWSVILHLRVNNITIKIQIAINFIPCAFSNRRLRAILWHVRSFYNSRVTR